MDGVFCVKHQVGELVPVWLSGMWRYPSCH